MTRAVLVVPVRDFASAKSRLADVFPGPVRSSLARLCTEKVLDRRVTCDRIVVCDSDEVEAWSHALGATCVRVESTGLNAAMGEALPRITALYPDAHLVIAHGDLIDPTRLDDLIAGTYSKFDHTPRPEVVLVPDRRHDGTNVLCLDTDAARSWTFEYGPGSFARHMHQAEACGRNLFVFEDDGLAIDLDTPEDLQQAEVIAFLEAHFPALLPPRTDTHETESS